MDEVRENRKKVTVAGMGYVGLSLAVVLSRKCSVTVVDTDRERVEGFRQGKIGFADPQIRDFLADHETDITAAPATDEAYRDADFVFVAVPTNYDESTGGFDTSSVEEVIQAALARNEDSTIVIRSTIPVGFTARMREKFHTDRIVFSPEFLRESRALEDSLRPSRIVIGDRDHRGEEVRDLLLASIETGNVPALLTGCEAAEAIKLLSHTYLAMRVAFFNEVDTLAEDRGLNAGEIIDGMGLDPRIGAEYNNPSFGYGGYCLPKDVKQTAAAFDGKAGDLIRAIPGANRGRMEHITDQILDAGPKTVGIYRINFKAGSGNAWESAVVKIMEALMEEGIRVIIYEPSLEADSFRGAQVIDDLDDFCRQADIIAANRMSEELKDYREKVYTRDLYGEN